MSSLNCHSARRDFNDGRISRRRLGGAASRMYRDFGREGLRSGAGLAQEQPAGSGAALEAAGGVEHAVSHRGVDMRIERDQIAEGLDVKRPDRRRHDESPRLSAVCLSLGARNDYDIGIHTGPTRNSGGRRRRDHLQRHRCVSRRAARVDHGAVAGRRLRHHPGTFRAFCGIAILVRNVRFHGGRDCYVRAAVAKSVASGDRRACCDDGRECSLRVCRRHTAFGCVPVSVRFRCRDPDDDDHAGHRQTTKSRCDLRTVDGRATVARRRWTACISSGHGSNWIAGFFRHHREPQCDVIRHGPILFADGAGIWAATRGGA